MLPRLFSPTLLLLLSAPAGAAELPAAWYDPDQVASHSALFASAAEELGPRYEALDDALRKLGPALEDLELATLLAGDRLPAATRDYTLATRTAAAAAHLSAQRHVDFVQESYAEAFGSALQRAIDVQRDSYTIAECGGGGSMAAMMGRSRHCEGTDLNLSLARAIDADAVLAETIAAINARPWPEIDVSGDAQPVQPLTGTASWVQLAPLARALWQDRLDRRSDDLDRALAPLEDELDAGEASALSVAQEQRDAYEAALAADGEVFLALVAEALERKARKGGADVGFCVNPVALGGCPGSDRTDEVIALIADDRRVIKGLAGLP